MSINIAKLHEDIKDSKFVYTGDMDTLNKVCLENNIEFDKLCKYLEVMIIVP